MLACTHTHALYMKTNTHLYSAARDVLYVHARAQIPKCNGEFERGSPQHKYPITKHIKRTEDEILITLRYLCNPQWCLI